MDKSKLSFNFKQWRIESLLVALFLVFMCCVFAPLEFYNGNFLNFWFAIDDIAGFIIVLAISITAVTLLVFSVDINGKPYLGALLWGLMIALYIQGNFVVKDYGWLDGHEMHWDLYSGYSFINLFMWMFIPLSVCIMMRYFEHFTRYIIRYVSICITVVQAITICALWILNPVELVKNEETVFTTDGIFDYSNDENIVLFIADTFSSDLFEQLINENPSLMDCYDGFTWYNDFSGSYQFTDEAVGFLFNPDWDFYKEHNRGTYEIIDKGHFFDKLINDAGYSVGCYSSVLGFSNTNVAPLFYNVKNIECDSRFQLGVDYYKMLAFRYVPHIFKQYFVVDENTFERHRKTTGNAEPFSYVNEDFDRYLNEKKFTNNELQKKFEVIHIRGAHYPYTITSELDVVGDNETDILNQSVATIKIFAKYLERMKENGTYDNTTIFFMGDHGIHNFVESQPVFLMKQTGERGVMKIDDTPSSATQFVSTIYSIANIDYKGIERAITYGGESSCGIRKYKFLNPYANVGRKDWIEYDIYPGLFMKRESGSPVAGLENDRNNETLITDGKELDSKDVFIYSQVGMDEDGNVAPGACFVFPTEINENGIRLELLAKTLPEYKYQFYVENKMIYEYISEQSVSNKITIDIPLDVIEQGVVYLKIKTIGHIVTGNELAISDNPAGRGNFFKIEKLVFSKIEQ